MDLLELPHEFSLHPDTFVAELDAAELPTLEAFYPRIAQALQFPDYFGDNLDALFDSLGSLEALEAREVVVIIRNGDQFLRDEPEDRRHAALQVLRDAQAPENRYDEVDLKILLIR